MKWSKTLKDKHWDKLVRNNDSETVKEILRRLDK